MLFPLHESVTFVASLCIIELLYECPRSESVHLDLVIFQIVLLVMLLNMVTGCNNLAIYVPPAQAGCEKTKRRFVCVHEGA